MLRLANRWTVDTLDTFVVFRLELKSSKKFIYHFFLFNGGVSNAADPDELSSFGMLKDLTVFVFNSTTQPVDGHWKHDMNGKENRIRGLVSWLHNEFLLILAGCWKYSRVETFLVTLRESDLMGLPVDRVAVPADIVKSHGKWCCNCQKKHNLRHVVDIHEIHNLLSMQWPLHQISVFIMGNMDCVMPSSPSILTLFLGDLTCLSSRDCLCHIIGILPSHQLYWTQHQLTWDALLASAETWAEWLSLSVGWPSPQGLDSASGGQADIGAPTPTNPNSFSTYTAIS